MNSIPSCNLSIETNLLTITTRGAHITRYCVRKVFLRLSREVIVLNNRLIEISTA